MFLSGKPLRSAYRVIARDGRVVWFHCEARMMRHATEGPGLSTASPSTSPISSGPNEALQEERNVVSAILDTVGALVVVLDPEGRIVRFNRACEQTTGYSLEEVRGKRIWDLFLLPEEVEPFQGRSFSN